MYYIHNSTACDIDDDHCDLWITKDDKLLKHILGPRSNEEVIRRSIYKNGIGFYKLFNICQAETLEELQFAFLMYKLEKGY